MECGGRARGNRILFASAHVAHGGTQRIHSLRRQRNPSAHWRLHAKPPIGWAAAVAQGTQALCGATHRAQKNN